MDLALRAVLERETGCARRIPGRGELTCPRPSPPPANSRPLRSACSAPGPIRADVKRWFKPTRLIMDAKVDGLWHSEVEWQGKRWPHYGRFTRLERPRLFEQTWMSEATHGLETVVRVELEPKGGGTDVRLTHSGLPD